MRAVFLAAVLVALLCSCGSAPEPHPTPDHKIAACYIACPLGYALRQQHLCRSDRTQFKDVLLTGEENDPNNPSESRWLTGVTSVGVERLVLDKLKEEGARPTDHDWSQKF